MHALSSEHFTGLIHLPTVRVLRTINKHSMVIHLALKAVSLDRSVKNQVFVLVERKGKSGQSPVLPGSMLSGGRRNDMVAESEEKWIYIIYNDCMNNTVFPLSLCYLQLCVNV